MAITYAATCTSCTQHYKRYDYSNCGIWKNYLTLNVGILGAKYIKSMHCMDFTWPDFIHRNGLPHRRAVYITTSSLANKKYQYQAPVLYLDLTHVIVHGTVHVPSFSLWHTKIFVQMIRNLITIVVRVYIHRSLPLQWSHSPLLY